MTEKYLSRALGWKNWTKRRIKMVADMELDVAEIELERAEALARRVDETPEQFQPNERLSAKRDADRWRDFVRLKKETAQEPRR